MRKKLSIVNCQLSIIYFLFLTAYCLLLTVSQAASLEETVGLIEKKYSEIKDIQGGFSQTSYIKDIDRIEKYEGKFFIKKPSSMKWLYLKPRDEEVIILEGNIWIYKKSEKQAIKSAFSQEAYSQVPIALLNSLGNLKNDFDITLIKEDVLELTPKHRMGFINKIAVEVNSRDFPIKAFTVFDIYGNRIDIAVRDVRINPGLEDSFFVFKLLPGVEVFDFSQ